MYFVGGSRKSQSGNTKRLILTIHCGKSEDMCLGGKQPALIGEVHCLKNKELRRKEIKVEGHLLLGG